MRLRTAGIVLTLLALVTIVVPTSAFTPVIVGALVLSGLALLIGWTRPHDEWSMFRRSPTRMAKLSISWSGIAIAILGFSAWVSIQHPSAYGDGWQLGNGGRGVPVFVGLLGLAATFSIGTMLGELRAVRGSGASEHASRDPLRPPVGSSARRRR